MSSLGRSGANGFTLLEMLASIIIISVCCVLILNAFPRISRVDENERAVNELQNVLRLAQENARSIGIPIFVSFYAAKRCYQLWDNSEKCIPESLTWSVISTARKKDEVQVIIFYPNGTSTGGEIVIESNNKRSVLSISWLNGRIKRSGK